MKTSPACKAFVAIHAASNALPPLTPFPGRRDAFPREGIAPSIRAAGDEIGAPSPVTHALGLQAIHTARRRLRGLVRETPCTRTEALGAEAGVQLWLKRDDLQASGSFKERGAAHALVSLAREERARGVVAASAGNHALGLARHGGRLGVRVTLVMPRNAARVKVARCRAAGVEVVLEGDSFAETEVFARALARSRGARYVHPFDDDAVIAGQGTVALEVLDQVPELEAILVPVGGGGLLAGVATTIKATRPDVTVIAVEPAAAPSFAAAWKRGGTVEVPVFPTLADGLAVARVGERTFATARARVDAVVNVTEDEIAYAMLRLFECERAIVEGSGAVALAALLAHKLPELAGRKVVVPVCGGNVDALTFARAIERASVRNTIA